MVRTSRRCAERWHCSTTSQRTGWWWASRAPRPGPTATSCSTAWGCATAFVGAEEVTRGKPAPDLFLLGASRLGIEPRDVLVFEDAHLGVRAAVSAGMVACGVTTVERPEVLAAAGAIATAPDLDALPDGLRALWRRA